jgi:hypothetical protein
MSRRLPGKDEADLSAFYATSFFARHLFYLYSAFSTASQAIYVLFRAYFTAASQ